MADILSNLVLRCLLNEASGTECRDFTGRHAAGTYNGSYTLVRAPYGRDWAREFGGSSDVTFADATDLEASASMTCCFWTKTTQATTAWILTKPDAGFTTGFEFGINGGAGAAVLRPAGLNYQPGSPDFNGGTWQHVGLGIEDLGSGNVRALYWLNGVRVDTGGSIATTPGSNSDVLRIGSRRAAAYYVGALYDICLYSRTLSDADMLARYYYRGRSGRSVAIHGRPVGRR